MTGLPETWPWLEHLNAADWTVLDAVGRQNGFAPDRLRHDDQALAAVLSHPAAFASVWRNDGGDGLVGASPFLVFATAVHRGWADLQGAQHVDEWVRPGQRLPVLGGDDLRTFLGSGPRRLFLTTLLASYTRVASGSTWVHTGRGWRRRRFSELDPVRLASMLEVVPPAERPGVYRRLGDLALFLTGVFPDHTARDGFGPIAEGRLRRAGHLAPSGPGDDGPNMLAGSVGLLERLGERWYQLAARTADAPMPLVAEMAEQFDLARRVLNFVTDRYLFPVRDRWFGGSAS